MSELAFNINGEAFEVPANASGWRVRKMRSKGSPEVVYAREGQPLVLPVSAEIDDLRGEVDATGRYRLDLVDQNNKPIEGAPSGYVQINFDTQVATSDKQNVAAPRTSLTTASDSIVLESMRMQSMIAVSVVERFPQMVEAVATLLRAADGAGLPSRAPRAEEEADEEDETARTAPSSPGFALINNLVAQAVPLVLAGLSGKKLNVASVLDWRKASAEGQQQKHATAPALEVTTASKTATDSAETSDGLPALDPKTMAHFIAVQSALKPEEAALAREVAGDLGPAALRTWFDELSKLSVPDAVAKIRTLIGGAS